MATNPKPPALLAVNVDGIPESMKATARWAPWRAEWNTKKQKYEKIPHRADRPASGLSNRSTKGWSSFDVAMRAYTQNPELFAGVGYLMTGPHGLVAADLDHCVVDGQIAPWAAEVIAKLDSYTEVSPSGNGLRVMFSGDVDRDWTNHDIGIEVYGGVDARFVTITGAKVAGSPSAVRAPRVGAMDGIVARYRKAGSGAQIEDLHLPPLLPAEDIPQIEDLDIPPHARNFLLEGPEPGRDRSQALFATSIALVQSGLAPEVILSVLENNDHAMEVALDHRRQDYDKALRYLWKDHCNKGAARAGELRQLDLDQFDAGTPLPVEQRQPEGDPDVMGDFDDLAGDDFSDLLGETPAGAIKLYDLAPIKLPRFTPISLGAFQQRKRADWIIKGVLPRAGLAVIYGASGSGKTFLTLDIAGAVARGADWRGQKTARGRVIYIVAEGADGFRKRTEAYCQQHGLDPDSVEILVVADAPNLLDKSHIIALESAIEKVGPVAVIVIDTYARVMAGGNENDAKDTGQAVAHCDRLHRRFKALVVLVHHSGKDVTRGARGSGALRAAADLEIEVIQTREYRAATITKMKDGEDGKQYAFRLSEVVLGQDEDGFPITSCVVEHRDSQPRAQTTNKPLTPTQQMVLRVMNEHTALDGSGVHYADLKQMAVDMIPRDPESKKDNRHRDVSKAIEALTGLGMLTSVDGGQIVLAENY